MIIHNCEQRTATWYNLRCGKVTASNAHRLLTPAKFKTFMLELVAEQVTGELTQHYVSEAMQWGIDQEPFAMQWYAEKTGHDVEQVGFVEHEEVFAGCSPDLVVGDKGMAQIKCPNPKTHIDYFMNGPCNEIIAQMQFEMWIYEADWNDFVTYDPRWPEHMQGKIIRLTRDEAMIEKLATKTKEIICAVDTFLFENNLQRKKLNVETIEAPPINDVEMMRDIADTIKRNARYVGV